MAVQLVMALTAQTIALAWGKARHKEGLSQSRLQGEYFELLKQSKSAFTGRPWGSATATWVEVHREVECGIARACTSDACSMPTVRSRRRRVSSEEQIMATLVLSMCVEDERIIAA